MRYTSYERDDRSKFGRAVVRAHHVMGCDAPRKNVMIFLVQRDRPAPGHARCVQRLRGRSDHHHLHRGEILWTNDDDCHLQSGRHHWGADRVQNVEKEGSSRFEGKKKRVGNRDVIAVKREHKAPG